MDDLTKNFAVRTTQGGTPKGTPRTQIEQAYDALTSMQTYMRKYDDGGGTVSLDELGAARELVRRAAVHDAQREVAGLSAYHAEIEETEARMRLAFIEADKARRDAFATDVKYQRSLGVIVALSAALVGLPLVAAIWFIAGGAP